MQTHEAECRQLNDFMHKIQNVLKDFQDRLRQEEGRLRKDEQEVK